MSCGFRNLYVLSPPSFPQWDTDLAEQRRNVQVVFAGENSFRQLVCVIDAASPNRLPQPWGGGTGRCHLCLRLFDAWPSAYIGRCCSASFPAQRKSSGKQVFERQLSGRSPLRSLSTQT